MNILIVTPIPSHPQDQGNSARIAAIGRLLQGLGASVHLLYYPLEGLSPSQRTAMATEWDALHIVPVERVNLAPGPAGHHAIDAWYDPRVGEAAARLHARHRYRAVLVNYVWFSAVLERFGPEVLRILDTHDVFADRDQRFVQAGLTPEWFWTRPEEERRGLARADIVLAIQEQEAALFRQLGHTDVRVLGHLPPWRRRPPAPTADPVTIGYFASFNPVNLDSFRALLAAIRAQPPLPQARLLVAGTICERLGDAAPFTALGRLDHAETFYEQVDVVLNPMGWGTGLKIKSVEAIFEGRPLVATAPAMVGLPQCHPLHDLPDAAAIAACLPDLVARPALRADLAEASVRCAAAYGTSVRAALADLWSSLTTGSAGTSPPSGTPRSRSPRSAAPSRSPGSASARRNTRR